MNILEAMKQAFMITDSIYRGGVGGGSVGKKFSDMPFLPVKWI